MWNRLFKNKLTKRKNGAKTEEAYSALLSNKQLSTKVISDNEEVVDAGPEKVDLSPCPICSRTFAPGALEKHVGICEKMTIQKRTPFDSFRQRRKGTELAAYLPSDYESIKKSKRNKSPDTKSVSKMTSNFSSIASIHDSEAKKGNRTQRISPKLDSVKTETPLMGRSSKRTMGTIKINEICPHCGRSFGLRAYDRHVDWCKEKSKITNPTLSAQQHLAKERMQARTKYKAPFLRSKREKNREKYSSLSESMNNLSDSGGVSIMEFNSVADPFERARKCSIMSLSMTSSVASDCELFDKYDPFMSAKRQLEDLFSLNTATTSTPIKNEDQAISMSKSLNTKSPSSPTRNSNLSKSNFRRASSLRVPKKTPFISQMPKYKPSIQRGISDEGPISSNFMKPEEFDELPVKSHAAIPPDLVPKPKSTKQTIHEQLSPTNVVKRQNDHNSIRRKINSEKQNIASDFQLSKTDSLAAFLEFENDLEHSKPLDEIQPEKFFNKSLMGITNDLDAGASDHLFPLQRNSIKLAPIEKPLIKQRITLEPIVSNIEFNNNKVRVDDNENSIDFNFITSCDNLRTSHSKKSLDSTSLNRPTNQSIGNISGCAKKNCNLTENSSSTESINSHHNMEIIVNQRNLTDSDKRNPKRQLRLQKHNLLFDISNKTVTKSKVESTQQSITNNSVNYPVNEFIPSTLVMDDEEFNENKKQNFESMFDDFDLEEFISSFSDNEQFPIFKNYKEALSVNSPSKPQPRGPDNEQNDYGKKTNKNRNICSESTASNSIQREIEIDENKLDNKLLNYSIGDGVTKKPDVTVEAEQQLKMESELNKLAEQRDTKLKLQQILGDVRSNDDDDGMTLAERELLVSVQELNEMCDERKPDLTSTVSPFIEINSSEIHSPTTPLATERRNNPSRCNPLILKYQIPELIGTFPDKKLNESSRIRTAPVEHSVDRMYNINANTFSKSFNNKPTSPIDRTLPPITLHKNDSQNIYNAFETSPMNRFGKNFDSSIDNKKSAWFSLKEKDLIDSNTMKLSKFCHECGAKFIVEQAKFCMECGVKRVTLE